MDEEQREPETMEPEKDDDAGLGDHARELRSEFSPDKLNESLEEAVKERPLLDHLLDLGIVAQAVAIGVIGALILWLLIGPGAAAVALVVLFLGSWYGLAQRSYDKRRPTQPADDEDEDEDTDAGESKE
ncbi:MAG: hypothetical protein QOD53_2424 [Thermoleophilaceae bacterium]|jgi:Flp pilus assembly protein TadB|nr:hypothetical protein [Thermoleophilaceae bacterium]